MRKPILLDLFCKAGGAAMGYHRAGFEVVGVDIEAQPRYPFEFVQADAMTFPMDGFDAIHASPPCQGYSSISRVHGVIDGHPRLIEPVRERLRRTGKLYVIENVPGAPLITPAVLCGSALGMGAVCHDGTYRQLRRHRLFESDVLILASSCQHDGEPIGVYGHGGGQFNTVWNGGHNRGWMGSQSERQEAMGIDWMAGNELSQAIPPAYTEYIGRQLIRAIATRA